MDILAQFLIAFWVIDQNFSIVAVRDWLMYQWNKILKTTFYF